MPPTTSPLLTEAGSRRLLRTVEDAFVEAHLHAWRQWQRLRTVCQKAEAEDLLLPLSPTTRANFVNNHCIAKVVGALEAMASDNLRVRVLDDHGFTCVLVTNEDGAAVVRFKFIGPDLLPRNVATKQQRSVDRQEFDPDLLTGLELPGSKIPTWIICGYRLTADETEIDGIHIVCKQNRNVEWSYTIYGGEAKSNVVNIPLPGSPPRTSRVSSKRRRPVQKPAEGQGDTTP